ncbi:MAG: HD domain-containing protein [Gemmatimonadetes bacterium]|nr:HD domain-containing protein [Gemmatimonadota bacterium]
MTPETPGSLLQSESVLQPLGRSFVTAFYVVAQALKLYPMENTAVQNALEELQRVVRRIVDREGALELRQVGDFLFLNDARLRVQLSDFTAFSVVAGLLARHRVGSIEAAAEVARDEWARLIALLLQEPSNTADPFERLADRLAAAGVPHIQVSVARKWEPGRDPLESDDVSKEVAKRTYLQSVAVAKGVLTDIRLGRAVNLRRVKRAVQGIVDQVLHNETTIIGMTTLRDFDEYTFTHSVNVCIFSVVIGQKLGLTKPQLYELGLAALFHDIGKMRLPAGLINKPGDLTPDEWRLIQQHPTEGLLALFQMRGMTDVPYRPMLVAYEHHMKTDLTGYPKNKRPRTPRLFSRIVAVADGFDAATSKRSYRSLPWPPDEVVREMRDNPARGYDPLLVKAFMNVTGIYPVGTLVILDTHEMAIVVARNPDPKRVHHPIVKIITDYMGVRLAEPKVHDLSEVNPETGLPLRSIIKTTDPDKYGIRVSDYFV